MKRITYAIDTEGATFSRVDDQIATCVLDYEGMTPENGYDPNYTLEKFPIREISATNWQSMYWTKKLPLPVKNQHRVFWEMPELKTEAVIPRWYLDWGVMCYPNDPDYTAPVELKAILSDIGCSKIKRSCQYGNKEIGVCWVFDLASANYGELLKAIEKSNYNYLSPEIIRWNA